MFEHLLSLFSFEYFLSMVKHFSTRPFMNNELSFNIMLEQFGCGKHNSNIVMPW